MSDTKHIRPFGNGEAYRTWLYNNCSPCVKADGCPLEYALSSACVLDGTITPAIADRLGVPADGSERWWCRERQTVASGPPPAAHEVAAAGGAQLPGFEDVAERPAERYPR